MNRRRRPCERPAERDIASLADGRLAPERRERVERAVAASAELQAALRDQRLAIAAVRATAEEPTPVALRHAVGSAGAQ
jgi:anti-sigma factor RsiW